MIRELTNADRERVLEYLQKESSLNLFLIGDIHNHGFQRDFMQLWGDFDGEGNLRAVLLRWYNNYLPYSRQDFDASGFVRLIRERGDLRMMSGIAEVVNRFKEVGLPLDWSNRRDMHFAELTSGERLVPDEAPEPFRIRKATLNDVPKMMELQNQIVEFAHATNVEQSLRKMFESGDGRAYLVTLNDQVVAMGRTTAENPYSGMVVGVATHPDHRKKGLGSLIVSRLSRELLAAGKHLCLFYDNPAAGSIYRRLGYREIGMWSMVHA
ncbi:GNAT family N-acetyltransferase [Staphylospora marina]|uniref:GNAT family N-acetyltransferase n=1 Tax=Staphylospora marina TaxID=2490858 RepID=UPI0013DE3A4D|nr:GNAT family N-acetyltransferase [Staphylospora marina]